MEIIDRNKILLRLNPLIPKEAFLYFPEGSKANKTEN